MCGITGWVDFTRDLRQHAGTIQAMVDTMARRGPDAEGTWIESHVALGHRRLAIIDLEGGKQPMLLANRGPCSPGTPPRAVISYSGEVYNFRELREELSGLDCAWGSRSDTEVVLRAYLAWGDNFVESLNGMYAFAIWDTEREELLLVRDRLGVKPLFYYPIANGVIFGSEPKAILANPLVRARASSEELADALLFLRTPGRVPFMGMRELKPGHILRVRRGVLLEEPYWKLPAREHTDDAAKTIKTIRELLEDSVRMQMTADVPLCALLSGGLDSSAVAALAQRSRFDGTSAPRRGQNSKDGGPNLATFVVDFVDHEKNFRADPIRPNPDGPFAREAALHIKSDHHTVTLDKNRLTDPDVRDRVLRAWDTPCNFGDLDVSLLLLFEAVRKQATCALSGEAADELFGGYLWFSDPEALAADTFPWLKLGAHKGLDPNALFHPWFVDSLRLRDYQNDLYLSALGEVPHLQEKGAGHPQAACRLASLDFEKRVREVTYLTLTRWLPILLDKKDRMSMAVGLEGRVPFCDHRIVEYAFNIPWSIKGAGAQEKWLLREAASDLLPERIVRRKKAAYPSIQDAGYDRALLAALRAAFARTDSPLRELLSSQSLARLEAKSEAACLSEFERILVESTVRLDAWLRAYRVELVGNFRANANLQQPSVARHKQS